MPSKSQTKFSKLTSALDIFSKFVQHVSPKKEMKNFRVVGTGKWMNIECRGKKYAKKYASSAG
jgi:hypothetical protein